MRLQGMTALVMCVAALTVPPVTARIQQSQDATTVLAAARAALGGDVILNSITSFTVSGSSTETPGPFTVSRSVEISVELPDKFVRMTRRSMDLPGGGFTVTDYNGFNGSTLIHAIIAPGAPMPMVIPGPAPKTAAEAQAIEGRKLQRQKQAFLRLVLPLFAASATAIPVQFEVSGQATAEKVLTDVVTAKAADGATFRLHVDAATHLPVKLTWMEAPIVMFSTSSTVTTNSRGEIVSQSPSMGRPPANPTAGMPPVEWAVTFADYKTEGGLTWPRRFVTSFAGKKFEDMRLGKYKINVPIKPRTFEPHR